MSMCDHQFIEGHCVSCRADCPGCNGTGLVEIDTFNGEHGQYTTRCECNLGNADGDNDETPCE